MSQKPLKTVKKPDYIKCLGEVNVDELKHWTTRISERIWNREDEQKENRFSCFHHTRHIIFRFPSLINGQLDPSNPYSKPIWEAWKGTLLPVLSSVASVYGYQKLEYPKVMIARLLAGHKIDRHTDEGPANHWTHKIHIPIITNPQVRFQIDDKEYHLASGKAYEVNNLVSHAVINEGIEDRVHLIFEIFDAS
jgi:hypothetical protein